MRHFVNISLLFFFATLIASGLLRFLAPFSLTTTRVHVVFGFGLLTLVGLHLAQQWRYFARILGISRLGRWPWTGRADEAGERSPGRGSAGGRGLPFKPLAVVVGLWAALLTAALWDYPPASSLIALSYESRHRAAIFRPDPQSVFEPVSDGFRVKRATGSDADLLVAVEWGPAMKGSTGRSRIRSSGARPQIAVWAESKNGSLIETLYLSGRAAFSETPEWAGREMRRVHILPVWRHRYTLKTGIAPDGDVDAYSGATPEHHFSLHRNLATGGEPFYLYLEVNAPADPNGFFKPRPDPEHPGHMHPGVGQPSVIYGAYIEPKKDRQYLLLDLVGHGGSTSRQDGNIHYDTSELTSAKRLIEKVLVRVIRDEPTGETEEPNGETA